MKNKEKNISVFWIVKKLITLNKKGVFRYLFRAWRVIFNIPVAYFRRKANARNGLEVSKGVGISPTSRCNYSCKGCYARFNIDEKELDTSVFDRFLFEAEKEGVIFVVVSGGEPFAKPDMIDLFERHRKMFFLVITNGSYLNKKLIMRIRKSANVVVVVSVEGDKNQTDFRRGSGAYETSLNAMRLLRLSDVPFGFSVTLTRRNISMFQEYSFIGKMIDEGALLGFFNTLVPFSKEDIEFVPDKEDLIKFTENINNIRKKRSIAIMHLPDDEYIGYEKCLFVNGGAFHVNSQGYVEPCPFAHFAVENISKSSFKDVLRSPFLKAIREDDKLLKKGELGCSLVSHYEELNKLAIKYGAKITKN